MNHTGKIEIVLEQGTAEKPFHEMSDDEKRAMSARILQRVNEKARLYGLKPIVGSLDIRDARYYPIKGTTDEPD